MLFSFVDNYLSPYKNSMQLFQHLIVLFVKVYEAGQRYTQILAISFTPTKRSDAQPLVELEKQFESRPVEISRS